jgi:hypothetical protein
MEKEPKARREVGGRPTTKSVQTTIAGITHKNLDGTSRQKIARRCRPGESLRLVRDRRNVHNVYAIEVWRQDSPAGRGRQLGFIPAELSRELAEHLETRAKITARVVQVTGGGGMLWWKKPYGVKLLIEGIPE